MASMKLIVGVTALVVTGLVTPIAVSHYRARQAELKEDADRQAAAKLNSATRELINLLVFSSDHENRFPDPDEAATILSSSFELIVPKGTYQKFSDIKDLAGTIVLRETSAWRTQQGRWARAYGFADGHSEIGFSPDGDFGAFEQRARERRALATNR